jgi:hypothetical protein
LDLTGLHISKIRPTSFRAKRRWEFQKYVLDTNAVSALMKVGQRVVARLRSANREDVSIPRPVIAEIACGIERC